MNFNNKLDNFLSPTKFCDFNHPSIQARAKEITKNDNSPEEMALSIFHFVRDDIKFLMIYKNSKASETLTLKYGDCGKKTNLHVALLRAVNIPSRFHLVALSKECLKGLVTDFLYKKAPEIIPFHPYCECYLSGKWVACDSFLDKKLVDNVYKKGIFTQEDIPTIDWDGKNDLNTMTKWVIEDKGILPDLDKFYDVPESSKIKKFILRFFFNRSNAYTERLRKK
ncbi:MAG: transglutaminase-like domain-containing protein [Candidatus Heimdallarchaeota archaeon]